MSASAAGLLGLIYTHQHVTIMYCGALLRELGLRRRYSFHADHNLFSRLMSSEWAPSYCSTVVQLLSLVVASWAARGVAAAERGLCKAIITFIYLNARDPPGRTRLEGEGRLAKLHLSVEYARAPTIQRPQPKHSV